MFDVKFTVTRGRLAKLDTRQFENQIRQFQNAHVAERRRQLEYTADSNPARPPGSKYKRRIYRGQGLLGGWVVESSRYNSSGDLVADLHNTRPFAKKVYGDRYGNNQAAIHQGRWPRMADIRQQREYENGLRRLFRQLLG